MHAQLFKGLTAYSRERGIAVRVRSMDPETPAEFDGPTITINDRHDAEARLYYLAHSFGSIVAWAVDFAGTRAMYHELRAAKQIKAADPQRLERAIAAFLSFEQRASEYAVAVLTELGGEAIVPKYTEFFRADAEAMTIFHRDGKAPAWPDFFRAWKEKVRKGEIGIEPYGARPVPAFKVPRIEHQEVVQERDR